MEQRQQYKRKFGFGEFYRILVNVPQGMITLRTNKKSGRVGAKTIERIMLAVTEVNGCAACSYAHTQMALREGMSNEEIVSLLNGNTDTVPSREAKAVMFAQHFTKTKGLVDRDAYGIPYSALVSRLKGIPYRDSTLRYEIAMLFWGVFCSPFALIHAMANRVISRPIMRFGRAN